ncbi:MAG TPA: hypothetical protein VFV39_02885 [Limnobacter sp.]|nr:hypothetical protein [Limnobacter sp.]
MNTKSERQRYDKVSAVVEKLSLRPSDERAFWRNESGRVFVNIQDHVLTSDFLPVQETDSGDLLGHVAVLVDEIGRPGALDLDDLDDNLFVATDRLIRALHTLNYFASVVDASRLFLDVNHRFLASVADNHDRAFRHFIESLDLVPEYFVIQVLAEREIDLNTLAFAADNYRRNGFLTGLHSRNSLQSHSLIGQIRPDFLSLWYKKEWPMSDLHSIATAANKFRVRLIARNVNDQSLIFGLRQAGVTIFQTENLSEHL